MNSPARIVFFGTDQFASMVLETINKKNIRPSLIVTPPGKPRGRGLVPTASPVKQWGNNNNVPVIEIERFSPLPPELSPAENWDLFVVASFGKILPPNLMRSPQHGVLNLHPSLLPRYRGPSPIQAAILNGDRETGVTIILLDDQVDHGPIVAAKRIELSGHEWLAELERHLARLGGELMAETMPSWLEGKITPRPQDDTLASYTEKILKITGEISLNMNSDGDQANYRRIRAYTPRPGAYFFAKRNGKLIRIIIKSASLENGKLVIGRVVPEGRKETNFSLLGRLS